MSHLIEVSYVKLPLIPIQDLIPYLSLLTDEEKGVFHRYKVDHKKVEFLLGRLLLKSALSSRLGIHPEEITFCKNEYGKLFLTKNSQPSVHFNLSHTHGLLACAVTTECEVGIDVEGTHEDHLGVMKTVFVENEISYIQQQRSDEEKQKAFYRIWTRKEAVMKAIGKGFSLPPLSFSVPTETDADSRFFFYTESLAEGFLLSGAISNVVNDPTWEIEELTWSTLLEQYLPYV
ncbi:4'-phosphopantetheinyl transferase family protein [Marininema halotolerans]|uniref:4'-phosphopantetheinyl transferase n=1 Tax=Marininema halotolerans TaxID=1155944 RepID=A0A1I6UKA2_9BACL|nr:4'-phosphopantetheinyl transferase superfamily protein [Marininema halotolerans]SFT01882.1 4'-phosphopantetheinyl transferase [Marininema halotolerans]